MEDIDRQIARLAAKQFGVISRAQVLCLGLSPAAITRRISTGRFLRLHRGIYRLPGAPPSRRQTLIAAVLWAGPGSAASHRSAAELWGLDVKTSHLEISTPRRLESHVVLPHRVDPLPPEDLKIIDGIPCTAIDRTIMDLAAVLDLDSVEDALESALRKRCTSVSRLRFRIARESHRRGVSKLRKLLDERSSDGQPTESRFETRLHRLLRDGGLPPLRQLTVWDGGVFVARVDFCYPEAKVIVEADSYRWHSSKRAWQRDIERRNQLTALGWQIVHITWEDLTRRPQATLTRVRALMQPQLFSSSG
ncbi:MAG TPA: type IV toxin-antitoxin system AbiEi family antitoxin domain-containing protein [Actinomycetota bacterium]|nr:type IV toxin-antitoxin system AbiEi family antitoxin domain-containing protein [Actinomycetota bacterium]